jgi:hypothetical protein
MHHPAAQWGLAGLKWEGPFMRLRTRLLSILAVPALFLGISLASAGAASASTTPNANAAQNGKISATYDQFYFDSNGGHVVTFACTGEHIQNSAQTKENETCAITGDTSGLVAGTFASFPGGPGDGIFGAFGDEYWYSDYNGVFATSWQATFKQTGNGSWSLRMYPVYS